ncbi:MAG: UV DNA damage repair endonuclease UvsE [Candidatus Babeliales bacterium]|nr:UV DNA damage repair endonuclease UvsE [Candidatus Babeliales bacterium]
MKIGYPCINNSIEQKPNKTFRLNSYSKELFKETVESNLKGLYKILEYNYEHGLLFLRISSDTIPFASHPVLNVDWIEEFKETLQTIGNFIKKNNFRISMHPDQFIVLNSPTESVVKNSIAELKYHANFLDSLGLDNTAKIQIHVGGVYGNKQEAIERFVEVYNRLDPIIKKRLVIENDDKSYSLSDVYKIYTKCGIPIIFDTLHQTCFNNGEDFLEALKIAFSTWKIEDGIPMIDYSNQAESSRVGKHSQSIDLKDFENFITITKALDFDIMLEIKDKEISSLKALAIITKGRN